MDEETKGILMDIKAGIQYQCKLLESLLETIDAKQHDSSIKERAVREQLESFKSAIFDIPGLNTNPQAVAALNNLFSTFGGNQ